MSKQKAKKPLTKRWYFWAIIVVLVLGVFTDLTDDTDPGTSSSSAVSSSSSSQDDPGTDQEAISSVPSSAIVEDEPEGPEPMTGTEEPEEPSSPIQSTVSTPEEDPVESQEPEPEPDPEPEEDEPQEIIVYITETGAKYHRGSCRHLKDSKIEITLEEAIARGYEPCGTCDPPTE